MKKAKSYRHALHACQRAVPPEVRISELVGDPLAALNKGANPCASSMAIGLADSWWVELDCVWVWLGLGLGEGGLVSDSVATLNKGSNPCASSRCIIEGWRSDR